jgi:hypothetical protein
VTVKTNTLFLNIPSFAMQYRDQDSIIFTKANDTMKQVLHGRSSGPAAKQFLVYDNASWRLNETLLEGGFANASAMPPLLGRLHDFSGKCFGPEECWGAIMTY